jgi:Tat protein translocase TatB subunit
MPMIGPLEIMLVAVVALLVFGPEKLPEMARTVGRTANQLRRMAADLKEEFNAELDFDSDDDASSASPTHAAQADEPSATEEATSVADDLERLNRDAGEDVVQADNNRDAAGDVVQPDNRDSGDGRPQARPDADQARQ